MLQKERETKRGDEDEGKREKNKWQVRKEGNKKTRHEKRGRQ